MRRSFLTAVTLAIAATVAAAPALATSFNTVQITQGKSALEAMRELNVITFSTLNENNHVQGKTFVGGSLNASGANFGQGGGTYTASNYATLTVAGSTSGSFSMNPSLPQTIDVGKNLDGSSLSPDNYGAIRVGGNINNFQNLNGGGTITYGGTYGGNANSRVSRDATIGAGGSHDLGASLATTASTLKTQLTQLSTELAALTTNGVLTSSSGNNPTFDFSGASGYGAYTISASSLFGYNGNLNITGIGNLSAIVINVTGAASNMGNLNMNLDQSIAQKVIFNFIDATSFTVNSNFTGSLLATQATLTNTSNITGSVVANVFNQNAEVHLGTFQGSDAVLATVTAAVPEPTAWVMMIIGFGLIGGLVRRQKEAGIPLRI